VNNLSSPDVEREQADKSALPGATEVAMFRPLVEVWRPDSSTMIFAPPVGIEPTTDRLEGCCSIL
jgi:hypothetical protein